MFGSDRTTAALTILNDMDRELTSLESKLGKARYHKQCLIQELLIEMTIFLCLQVIVIKASKVLSD